ncbi:MAG: hypothetical protein AAF039_10110 [Bacteroidota bacterium]
MKQSFTLFFLLIIPYFLLSQHLNFKKSFEHFDESRGDTTNGYILTLPYEETVVLTNPLNSSSGLGATFNYFGTVIVVDQMNILPNGERQLVLRREDGKDFYGFRPTIKAVLTSIPKDSTTTDNN